MSQSSLTPEQREHANKRTCFWKRKQTLLRKCNELHTSVGADVYLAMKFRGKWHQFISSSNPAFPPSRDDISVEYPVPSVSTPKDFASSRPQSLRGAALHAALSSQLVGNQPAHDVYSACELRPIHEDRPLHGLVDMNGPPEPLGEHASGVSLGHVSSVEATVGVSNENNDSANEDSADSPSAAWATDMPQTPPPRKSGYAGPHTPPPTPGPRPSRAPQRSGRHLETTQAPLHSLTAAQKITADTGGNARKSLTVIGPHRSATALRGLAPPAEIWRAPKKLPPRALGGRAYVYNQGGMAFAARPAIYRVMKHRKGKAAKRGARRF